MLARKIAFLATLAVLVILMAGAPSPAQGKGSDSVVKAVATATKLDKDGKQEVTITITITDSKYHLYANPVGNDELKSNEVTVSFAKVKSAKINYPAGELEKDKVVGEYKIYKDKVTIKASVERTKGDTGALAISIKLQACSKKSCLGPSTIKISVP